VVEHQRACRRDGNDGFLCACMWRPVEMTHRQLKALGLEICFNKSRKCAPREETPQVREGHAFVPLSSAQARRVSAHPGSAID
jgi:hypothetical protein